MNDWRLHFIVFGGYEVLTGIHCQAIKKSFAGTVTYIRKRAITSSIGYFWPCEKNKMYLLKSARVDFLSHNSFRRMDVYDENQP
jgi:hypothetical protein